MAKIRVKVKSGTKGKPLGKRISEIKAKQGEGKGKELYKPKARLNVHFKNE